MKQRFFLICLFTLITYSGGFAQTGELSGFVIDLSLNKPLEDVLIQIQGTGLSTVSDNDGKFTIRDIPVGKYYLIFSHKGFYSLIMPDVNVSIDKDSNIKAEMARGDPREYLFMEIGGIQVTADRELLAGEPETIHKISAGEIEHMQANSLANVLSLVPGNIQSVAPGLQKQQRITLRTFNNPGSENAQNNDQAALFGTKIVVDDIPQTNNADLQTGVGVGFGSSVQNTNNTQYDLRGVVAENLEKVEVQSGASSVEYGDMTQGLIIAKTKIKNVPTRLKIKNNPDTREANLMGSFRAGTSRFIYNLNYGYSERDIRVDGDEYHRIAADIKMQNHFLNNQLNFLQILKYNRKIEEDNDASDPSGTKAYNRDHNITYSNQLNYTINESSHWYMRNYINFKRRNSWRRKLETPDLLVWTDRMTPGTREGIIPEAASYFSEVRTLGYEWSYGSKLKFSRRWLTGNTLHNFLGGAEFQTDQNTGPGKSYDLLRPPGGKTSERPRSFSDIPGVTQLALFAEDRITGTLLFPYTLNLGFRLDTYNPTRFNPFEWFSGKDAFDARQGTFFNPQFGLKIKPFKKTQIRLTYNKSSKSPSLSTIHPAPFYLDVLDQTYRLETDSLGNQYVRNIDLVSTYRFDQSSDKLKGYQSTKIELSVDQQVGEFGLSITGYLQHTDNTPRKILIPYSYDRLFWLDWPENTNRLPIESFSTTSSKYGMYTNLGWTKSSGIEVRLTSHRIRPLNMRFTINGAYNFKKYSSKDYRNYGGTRFFTAGDTLPSGRIVENEAQLIPYYQPTATWRQQAVVNYKIDYIAPPLGIWMTLRAQHVFLERDLDIINPKPHANGYYLDGSHYTIDAATSTRFGLDKTYQTNAITTDKAKPNDQWMFSMVVSKSLFKGAEVSLFVENIFNDRAYYYSRNNNYIARNHEIFWGVAFSSKLGNIFQ